MIADQFFDEYTKNYDPSQGRIHLKIVHTHEVTKVMDTLTAQLGLDERMRRLAHITAVFHDIGRFEQVRRFNTFLDHLSVDHAELGCVILEEEKLLVFLPEREQKMIIEAIRNHNKLAIRDGLDEETLLLVKLIRDADKTDIYRMFATEDPIYSVGTPMEVTEQELITDEVYESILRGETVDKRVRRTSVDHWVGFLALMNDMNFPETIALVKEAGYYKMQFEKAHFAQQETRERIAAIFKFVEERNGI